MKRAFLALGLFICFHGIVQAQEQLYPLMGNLHLLKHREFPVDLLNEQRAAAGDTLPFFDDFSEPFNKKPYPGGYWPDQSRWTDFQAFINDNLPIDPISVGVATLDGVDGLGRPYSWFASNFSQPADTLTSVPIDLSNTTDTVILSFFYQPGGRSSYDPEPGDSLIVQFKDDTDSTWHSVWSTEGSDSDSSWQLVMLPVQLNIFLHDSFQFRFRNYASLHSNGDFWHIDYVMLDDERSLSDSTFFDVSVLERTGSFLKKYESMPWEHFKTDPQAFMGDTNIYRLRNNADATLNLRHNFKVVDVDDNEDFYSQNSNFNIFPGNVCSNLEDDCGTFDMTEDTEMFVFSTASEISTDSTYFEIRNILTDALDSVPSNDSVVYMQNFYNYYAYDDGTAEVAYGLGFIEEPGRVALRYDIAMSDTLRGVQMYLDPVRWNLSEEPFQIEVWQGDSMPEELIFATDTIFPQYTGTDIFYHYVFDSPVFIVEGEFFVGWTQPANEETTFTVGFDLSTDASSNLYYNLSNDWVQSSIPGTVMLRPMFGNPIDETPNSIKEIPEVNGFGLFPNPTSDILNVQTLSIGTVTILDMTGRSVLRSNVGRIDVSDLDGGVYLVNPTDAAGRSLGVKRFIKR